YATNEGAGLNVAALQQVRPGLTVKDENPDRAELEELLERSLEAGAIGLKILGGHYPMTPEATRETIEVANEARAYVAFHGGSTRTGSNIEGFIESVELARDLKLHIPHINSYCRGQIRERALDEIVEALDLLTDNRDIVSESYLATINGTSGKCTGGVPESKATQQCLTLAGYPATEEGLEAAIRDGWARINAPIGGENVNITGEEAVRSWRERDTITSVNFPVNSPVSRLLAATARDRDGNFVVDAIASDGGAHPRNVNVSSGMALVRTEVLTPEEFVLKTSLNPARMLGCPQKGHLGEGADADVTGIDPESGRPAFSFVGGRLVSWYGALVGSGSTLLTTELGVASLKDAGLTARAIDPSGGMLYGGRPEDPFSLPG
ncbi:MAG: amidohydrolase family protein, partial [Clostridia bacterium]